MSPFRTISVMLDCGLAIDVSFAGRRLAGPQSPLRAYWASLDRSIEEWLTAADREWIARHCLAELYGHRRPSQ